MRAAINLGKERYVEPAKNKPAPFIVESPKRGLNQLVVNENVRKQISRLLTKVKNYDLLYNQFGLKEIDSTGGRTSINLYGPPGTGKSFAAEAIAYELGKKIIRVNYAELESKFVGETPKNIKAIFNFAREKDAVLIFDEADSILGKRLSSVTQSTDHAVNLSKSVMLTELDHFSGITIFTTNFGENYDTAFVRRIIGHIKFSLPDFENRRQIFELLLPEKLPVQLLEKERERILTASQGLSGGDLLNMVIYASMSAVERNGKDCQVKADDFLQALSIIKLSHENIGQKKDKNHEPQH